MEKQLKRIIRTQNCGHKLLMDSIEHDRFRVGVGGGMSRQLTLCCEYKLCHKN